MNDHRCDGGACAATAPISEAVAPPPASSAAGGTSLRIRGMDCADEVATLRRALGSLVAPDDLSFDVLQGRMDVPEGVDLDALRAKVAETGMRAELWVPREQSEAGWWAAHGRAVWTAASGAGTAAGFVIHALLEGPSAAIGSEGMGLASTVPLAAQIAYGVGVFTGLRMVLPKAWYAARSLRPDMNLLMTIAVAGALGVGEWFEAATVSALFALSLLLESWSVERARRAVERLLSLTPPRVRVRRGDAVVEVDPAAVDVGTVFLVRPGERVGLDGVVVAGATEIDQAPITGESVPVPKGEGDEVFAGTINGNGAFEARSTGRATDTLLARIVTMVGEARKERSAAERWVERFARVYTPAIFLISVCVAVLPPLLFGGVWADWFYRSLVFLVIGCPCALVISTPVAVVAGLASAARRGVLVKGGTSLERPAGLKAVALDKTGTLTEGRPKVVEVISLDDHGPEELLAVAAAIEGDSTHPIARAIVEHARAQGVEAHGVKAVEIVPGKGATGLVGGETWWLGSHRWVEERGQETPALHGLIEGRAARGHTAVVVGSEDHVCGVVMLADAVRSDAAAAVRALQEVGLRVSMLTGDNAPTAAAVAAEVGIEDVHAELLPADKVAAIERLEREVGPVAMIGDGVNDAPALARATLGVAMGAMGTDVAVETADVALMTDDLSRLAWLVRHSRRLLGVIRQNVAFALGVKALFVVLTMLGMASLWGAIAADMGASLLVVFNALRLLHDPQ